MGARLEQFFKEAFDLGGFPARIRLARETRIASAEARTEPDSADNVARFEKALAALRAEHKANRNAVSKDERRPNAQFDQAMNRLNADIIAGALKADAGFKQITQSTSEVFGVERSSLWFLNESNDAITCACLYSAKDRKHSSGLELSKRDFPGYFKAMLTERTIPASDARTDPRTKEFTEVYLKPLGIHAMLDIPIWRRGKMLGVLCNEHTGGPRTWTTAEEDHGYSVASLAGWVSGR